MKLDEKKLYLINRGRGYLGNGESFYIIGFPVYDMKGNLEGWKDQTGLHWTYYEDDKVIGSIHEIENFGPAMGV
jgi:hypothetical protein